MSQVEGRERRESSVESEVCAYCGGVIQHANQACPARHDAVCTPQPALAVDTMGFVALDTGRHLQGGDPS